MTLASPRLMGATVIWILGAAVLWWNHGALAQDVKPPVIIVIDNQKILREAAAVRLLQQQINEQRSIFQKQLTQQEQELRKKDQELVRQRAILSVDAFVKKRKELEEQVASVQRGVQERKKGLEKLFNKSMGQIHNALLGVAAEIAEERAADLVLSKSALVLVNPSFDITDDALKRLNERLPSISLVAPQN
jgi:Skp family chaperone for outer membrane proteins